MQYPLSLHAGQLALKSRLQLALQCVVMNSTYFSMQKLELAHELQLAAYWALSAQPPEGGAVVVVVVVVVVVGGFPPRGKSLAMPQVAWRSSFPLPAMMPRVSAIFLLRRGKYVYCVLSWLNSEKSALNLLSLVAVPMTTLLPRRSAGLDQ